MYSGNTLRTHLNRTLTLYLTGHKPTFLWRIQIKVVIEGVIFEEILEAEPDIKWNLLWNGLDAYDQKVIGQTIANVEVKYLFTGIRMNYGFLKILSMLYIVSI